MRRTNPGKNTQAAKKSETGQAPINQTVGNTKQPESGERRMASNTSDTVGFRGPTRRHYRAWWSGDQSTHEEDKRKGHQRHIQITDNEIEKIAAERMPQLRTSMFVVRIRTSKEIKGDQRYEGIGGKKPAFAEPSNERWPPPC